MIIENNASPAWVYMWVIWAFSKMQTPILYVFDEAWDAANRISK